jgi:hypothetical protein
VGGGGRGIFLILSKEFSFFFPFGFISRPSSLGYHRILFFSNKGFNICFFPAHFFGYLYIYIREAKILY